MGAKIVLKGSAKILKHAHKLDRCYLVSDQGEEVKVTKEMIRLACAQILSRCKR